MVSKLSGVTSVRIDDIMNSEMYCSILKTKMLPSLLSRYALFQHNNDSKPHVKQKLLLKKNIVRVIL